MLCKPKAVLGNSYCWWLGRCLFSVLLFLLNTKLSRIRKNFMKNLSILLMLVATAHVAGCANYALENKEAGAKANTVSKNCGRNMTQRSKCKDS